MWGIGVGVHAGIGPVFPCGSEACMPGPALAGAQPVLMCCGSVNRKAEGLHQRLGTI